MCGKSRQNCRDINDMLEGRVYLNIGGRVYSIDECIHHIVAALNAGGVPTTGCCCGHGNEPGFISLNDGRYLGVFANKDEFEKFVTHRKNDDEFDKYMCRDGGVKLSRLEIPNG